MMCYQRTIVKTAAFSSALLIGSVNAASEAPGRPLPTMEAIRQHSCVEDLGEPSLNDIPELQPRAGYKRSGSAGPAATSSASSEEQEIKNPYKIWSSSEHNKKSTKEQVKIMHDQLMPWTNGFVLEHPANTVLCCWKELRFMNYWTNLEDEELQRELFHYCRVGIIGIDSNSFGGTKAENKRLLREKRAKAKAQFFSKNADWDSLPPKDRADLLSKEPSCVKVLIMNNDKDAIDENKEQFSIWKEHLNFYKTNGCWQCCIVTGAHIEDGHSVQDMKSNSNPRHMAKPRKSILAWIKSVLFGETEDDTDE